MVLRAALHIMAGSYLQTRLLVHDYEKMVKQKKKSDDRSARALSCGIGPVRQAEASGFGHLQAQHVSCRYNSHPKFLFMAKQDSLVPSRIFGIVASLSWSVPFCTSEGWHH